jgi:hypothetical protein
MKSANWTARAANWQLSAGTHSSPLSPLRSISCISARRDASRGAGGARGRGCASAECVRGRIEIAHTMKLHSGNYEKTELYTDVYVRPSLLSQGVARAPWRAHAGGAQRVTHSRWALGSRGP